MEKLLRDIQINEHFWDENDTEFKRIEAAQGVSSGDIDAIVAINIKTNEPYLIYDETNVLKKYRVKGE